MKTKESLLFFRFLLSKAAVERASEFTVEERAILCYCYDRCNEEKDPSFRKKWFNESNQDLKNLFLWISGTLIVEPCHDKQWYLSFLQRKGSLVQAHAYFGWRKKLGDLQKVFFSINRLLRKDPKPKRWMGVGYRDKGTARDSATDGSPSWTEIVSSQGNFFQNRMKQPVIDYLDSMQREIQDGHFGRQFTVIL